MRENLEVVHRSFQRCIPQTGQRVEHLRATASSFSRTRPLSPLLISNHGGCHDAIPVFDYSNFNPSVIVSILIVLRPSLNSSTFMTWAHHSYICKTLAQLQTSQQFNKTCRKRSLQVYDLLLRLSCELLVGKWDVDLCNWTQMQWNSMFMKLKVNGTQS